MWRIPFAVADPSRDASLGASDASQSRRMKPRTHAALNLALLLAIVATGTWWVLPFTTGEEPAARVVATPSIDVAARPRAVDMTPVARLFGTADVATPMASSLPKLVGVIAVGGAGHGVALLAVDGQPAIAVRAGESVNGSLELAAVHADRVILRGPDGDREVRLPPRSAAGGIDAVR